MNRMTKKQTRPFRSISIIVPLNPPASQEKRQRNKKLYYLLRWLRYGLQRGNGNSYCRIEPQDAPPTMPHGAYRLSAQIQSKLVDFLHSPPVHRFYRPHEGRSHSSGSVSGGT